MEPKPQIHWTAVGLFIFLAYALGWLIALPLHLNQTFGLPPALVNTVVPLLFMWTPALATWIVVRWVSPTPGRMDASILKRFEASLGGENPTTRRLGMTIGKLSWPPWILVTVGIILFAVATPFVGAAFGLYELDFGLSGLQSQLDTLAQNSGKDAPAVLPNAKMVILMQMATLPLGILINCMVTYGEEIGWRGFLQSELRPLGPKTSWTAIGVIWALWHLPMLTLGHNYPLNPETGWIFMIGMCITFSWILGWAVEKTQSVWPAVVGHAVINAIAGFIQYFPREGTVPDPRYVGLTGVTGWILPILVLVVMGLTGQLSSSSEGKARA